ncbi:unnamed protein product, partial [Prorocentrum cordatum]
QSLRDKIDAIGKAQSAKEAAEIRAKEAEIRAECAQGQLLQQAQQVPAMVQEIAACMLRGAGSRLRMGARGTRFNPELVAVKIEADDDSGRAIIRPRATGLQPWPSGAPSRGQTGPRARQSRTLHFRSS